MYESSRSRNQKTKTVYKIEIKLSLRIEVDGPQKQTDFWTFFLTFDYDRMFKIDRQLSFWTVYFDEKLVFN